MSQPAIYYFDNNATTRVAPEVVDAMIPFLREHWGNPSSTYVFGRQVGEHVDRARARVAALINAEPREIIFTSCGTESNNSAIQSALVDSAGETARADHRRRALGEPEVLRIAARSGVTP